MGSRVIKRRKPTGPALDDLVPLLEAGEGELLGDVARFVRRFVVMAPAQLVATSLWVIHTHAVGAAEQTPYLVITSPEKQCGKTRLIEVLELLVARPWHTVLPSEAVIYRRIHAERPTLLLDEVDTIFNPRSADKHEGLRALINAGNRRGVTVPRCLNGGEKLVHFRVYSAKALAGIGTLPDTITDRSIPIRMKRRARDERVERLRRRDVEPEAEALVERIEAWATKNAGRLERARPTSPEELSDRMQDASEPLLAIADRLGKPWPPIAREAIVSLCVGDRDDDASSMRLRLLTDVRAVFEERGRRLMTTDDLLGGLFAIPEAPWATYYGRMLEPRDVAALLRHYGVRPRNVRVGDEIRKGYRRDELEDAWRRYT